jgi:D-sedoheptulose 7-phosphate isomerase
MPSRCDFCLRAPSASTPLIQQLHITAGHIVCGFVEERLFPGDKLRDSKHVRTRSVV